MTSSQLQLVPTRHAAMMPAPTLAPARARRPPGCKSRKVAEREAATVDCVRALAGTPAAVRSLLIEIDRDDANLILAAGDKPIFMWRLNVLPKEHMGLQGLRARARQTLDQVRVPRLCGSIEQIVVTSEGTALARSVLLDALIERLGAVSVLRHAEAAVGNA